MNIIIPFVVLYDSIIDGICIYNTKHNITNDASYITTQCISFPSPHQMKHNTYFHYVFSLQMNK